MVRRGNRGQLVLRGPRSIGIDSHANTPPSSAVSSAVPSALPSAYPSEDENETSTKSAIKPFPFLLLPAEIRNKIYGIAFSHCPPVIDLDPTTFRIFSKTQAFALFGVSRLLHQETSHHFFANHIFRIFPTYPGKYFKTKKPLLARLPARYRESITTLQLRLGPGWNNPPRGWIVNEALGLDDCTSVRRLEVFVECDPSDGVFAGFRRSEGFYEKFCSDLLDEVLKKVPTIKVVEFDAWNSVNRTGDMMSGLGEVVGRFDKVVAWGPERGWDKESDQVWLDAVLMHSGGQKLSKTIAVFG